tara:strand:+ start:720 stop:860 length:141 start_codon:yes stop_codon:yes gene_type:complete
MLGFGRYLFARDEVNDAPDSNDYSASEHKPTGTFKGGYLLGRGFKM